MKKVMFLIVGLLFSVSASAATLSLSGAGSAGATQTVSGTYNNGPLVLAEGEAGKGLTAGTKSTWNSDFDLTSDADTNAKVEFKFNPSSAVGTAQLSIFNNTDALSLGVWNVTGDFFTTVALLAGKVYSVDFASVTSSALKYNLSASVSAVPIPAALLLFAPALLGFFGLRRKAVVAA
jgi:hypothetical protein